ncbi:MAG: hypothetical protein J6K97_01820 [Clostridia bacterium]|nr:hypothetical protein [Clostridia bacterium]
MKKKILMFLFAICLILPCAVMFTGCGEQFIEERSYQLLGMTIIKDNTPGEGYVQFEQGAFATALTGRMSLEKCTIDVGRQSSVLVFDDADETGVKAEYNFSVYTGSEVYPAYSFDSYSVTINGEDATSLTQEQIASLEEEVRWTYADVQQFAAVCMYGDMSIQLITQNKSFACHVIITDKEDGSLVFMSMMYGY